MRNHFEQFRERLERERQRLRSELQLQEMPGEEREGSPYNKREESAAETFDLEKRLASVQHLQGQLADVEHALEKLAQGTYGQCDSCSQPIPLDRLEAIPQANLCLACKGRQPVRNGLKPLAAGQSRQVRI